MKRKIIQALLAVAIACGLWIYVITAVNPDDSAVLYEVPVTLSGETFLHERGLMLSDRTTQTVTLTLSGNRSDLNKVNKSNVTVVADLSKIAFTGKYELSYDIRFPGDVPDNAITVESHLPDKVTVNVEGRSQKDVDVEVIYVGVVPEGYIADKSSLDLVHKTINIIGPTAVLDKIDHARIEVDLENRKETINARYSYVFCDVDGNPVEDVSRVETKVTEVDLTLKIQKLKDVQLVPEIIYGGGATESTATVLWDIHTIQVAGSEQLLEGLDKLDLGEVDLSKVTEDTVLELPIVLPEGVTNLTGVTSVKLTISFTDLVTKTLSVSAVEKIHVPNGMNADVMTKTLDVTLRGSQEQIDRVTAADVVIVVDFSDAEPGSATYEAKIRVSGAFSDVGAIGSYSVSAKLSEK